MFKPIKEWNQIKYDFAGQHSIASDGDIYVVDNTGRHEILVFDSTFKRIQIIYNVGIRPHKVVYDSGMFYVLSSGDQTIYCYNKVSNKLNLNYSKKINFLGNSYVRSIKIIDGYMYFITNDREVIITNHISGNYEVVSTHTLPINFNQIVDVAVFNSEIYVSAMGLPEYGIPPVLVKGDNLQEICNGAYESIYNSIQMIGKPYFFEIFDNKLWITEVGEIANSVISIDNNKISKIYHRTIGVEAASWERSDSFPV